MFFIHGHTENVPVPYESMVLGCTVIWMLKLVVEFDAEDFLIILICCGNLSTVVSLEK